MKAHFWFPSDLSGKVRELLAVHFPGNVPSLASVCQSLGTDSPRHHPSWGVLLEAEDSAHATAGPCDGTQGQHLSEAASSSYPIQDEQAALTLLSCFLPKAQKLRDGAVSILQ